MVAGICDAGPDGGDGVVVTADVTVISAMLMAASHMILKRICDADLALAPLTSTLKPQL